MEFIYKIQTPEEILSLLRKRNLIIDEQEENIIDFFKFHSYYQVMLYMREFWNENHNFNGKITFSEIKDYYLFDKDLRELLFRYIGEIENAFKNIFCFYGCKYLGNTFWIEKENFNENFNDEKIKLLKLAIDKKRNNENMDDKEEKIISKEHIKNYIIKYKVPKYPPFWNMLEIFTFGEISKLYKFLNCTNLKDKISKEFGLPYKILENWIHIIVKVRNVCVHHNKLLNNTFTFIIEPKFFKVNKISFFNKSADNKIKSLGSALFVIYYLLQTLKLEKNFYDDLKYLETKYKYKSDDIKEFYLYVKKYKKLFVPNKES